jgi:hypothetical protein
MTRAVRFLRGFLLCVAFVTAKLCKNTYSPLHNWSIICIEKDGSINGDAPPGQGKTKPARINEGGDCGIMLLLVSKEYCVVQHGQAFFVCRRVWGGKLERLHECGSYGEAYDTFRLIAGS